MPWTVAHPAAPGGKAPGQHGGWLGKAFDPFRVDGDPNAPDFQVEGLGLPEGVTPDRLAVAVPCCDRTRHDDASSPGPARRLGRVPATGARRARLGRGRGAFQVEREDPRLRDRYGRHIHGQCLLLARRLVEAGVPLVTVNWHDDGQNFWDTHGDNFNQLKNRLMPPADQGFSALLDDLESRGLLDETLVVWVGEFGRHAADHRGQRGPRALAALLLGRPGRRRHPRRHRPRRLRPLGRLPGPRPGQPRRPRRHDPACPGHRPGDRDPRSRRPAAADQYRQSPDHVVRLDGARSGRRG